MVDSVIQTLGGGHFDYLDFERYPLEINNMAMSLDNVCRYSGQCDRFYSVAQHLLLVEHLMKKDGRLVKERMAGLFHDFAEAYFCDLPRPMKYSLPPEFISYYKQQEDDLLRLIFNSYGLDYNLMSVVKYYDDWALALESKRIMDKPFHNFPYENFTNVKDLHAFFDRENNNYGSLLKEKIKQLELEMEEDNVFQTA